MPRSLTRENKTKNSPAAGGSKYHLAGRSCNAPEIGRFAKKKGKPHLEMPRLKRAAAP
jgi:hypothetical protein